MWSSRGGQRRSQGGRSRHQGSCRKKGRAWGSSRPPVGGSHSSSSTGHRRRDPALGAGRNSRWDRQREWGLQRAVPAAGPPQLPSHKEGRPYLARLAQVYSGWRWTTAPRLFGGGLPTPQLLNLLPSVRPPAPRAPPVCGQDSLNRPPGRQAPHRHRNSSGGASSDSDAYGAILVGTSRQSLLAAMQGPAEPPDAPADPGGGLFHQALWELRASYQVCARCAGQEHLLAYQGDVDQWQRVMAEGHLPAAARTALMGAAAALQAELDVAQLAGGGL